MRPVRVDRNTKANLLAGAIFLLVAVSFSSRSNAGQYDGVWEGEMVAESYQGCKFKTTKITLTSRDNKISGELRNIKRSRSEVVGRIEGEDIKANVSNWFTEEYTSRFERSNAELKGRIINNEMSGEFQTEQKLCTAKFTLTNASMEKRQKEAEAQKAEQERQAKAAEQQKAKEEKVRKEAAELAQNEAEKKRKADELAKLELDKAVKAKAAKKKKAEEARKRAAEAEANDVTAPQLAAISDMLKTCLSLAPTETEPLEAEINSLNQQVSCYDTSLTQVDGLTEVGKKVHSKIKSQKLELTSNRLKLTSLLNLKEAQAEQIAVAKAERVEAAKRKKQELVLRKKLAATSELFTGDARDYVFLANLASDNVTLGLSGNAAFLNDPIPSCYISPTSIDESDEFTAEALGLVKAKTKMDLSLKECGDLDAETSDLVIYQRSIINNADFDALNKLVAAHKDEILSTYYTVDANVYAARKDEERKAAEAAEKEAEANRQAAEAQKQADIAQITEEVQSGTREGFGFLTSDTSSSIVCIEDGDIGAGAARIVTKKELGAPDHLVGQPVTVMSAGLEKTFLNAKLKKCGTVFADAKSLAMFYKAFKRDKIAAEFSHIWIETSAVAEQAELGKGDEKKAAIEAAKMAKLEKDVAEKRDWSFYWGKKWQNMVGIKCDHNGGVYDIPNKTSLVYVLNGKKYFPDVVSHVESSDGLLIQELTYFIPAGATIRSAGNFPNDAIGGKTRKIFRKVNSKSIQLIKWEVTSAVVEEFLKGNAKYKTESQLANGEIRQYNLCENANSAPSATSTNNNQSMTGDAIGLSPEQKRLVQRGLASKGFYKSSFDGDFGAGTRKALRSYQAAEGDHASGYLSVKQANVLIVIGREHLKRAQAADKRKQQAETVNVSFLCLNSMNGNETGDDSYGAAAVEVYLMGPQIYKASPYGCQTVSRSVKIGKKLKRSQGHMIFKVKGTELYGAYQE